MNATLLIGAFLGLTSVAAGAYANHGVDPENVGKVISAVRMQQIHSLVIVACGLAQYANLPTRMPQRLSVTVWLFVLAIVLFSGGIYLSYFVGFKGLSFLVPVGGTVFLLGWLALMWAAITKTDRT